MASSVLRSACLAAFVTFGAAALLGTVPARAQVVSNDVRGSALPQSARADRQIAVGQDTRWVNVDYGETVEFAVSGAAGARRFVWRFDGSADRLNLSELDREAGLNIPIYVNQSNNPLRQSGGY